MSFSKMITKGREDSGLKSGFVADKIGITYHTLYNYEKGVSRMPVDVFFKLAELYGLNTDKALINKLLK